MYCIRCGKGLEDGQCSSCLVESSNADSVWTRVRNWGLSFLRPNGLDWLSVMFRYLIILQALAGILYLSIWPSVLIQNPSDLSPPQNIAYGLTFLGVLASLLLARLRKPVGLLFAYLVSSVSLWLLPELGRDFYFNFYLDAGESYGLVFYPNGTLDDLQRAVSAESGDLYGGVYGWLVAVSFFALSISPIPVAIAGVIALGQSSISQSLLAEPRSSQGTGTPSNLAAIAFIAAFLVPLAGLVLGLVSLRNWKNEIPENRGLLVAAISISTLGVFAGPLIFVTILLPPLLEFFSFLS
jgi:hypothetical protein